MSLWNKTQKVLSYTKKYILLNELFFLPIKFFRNCFPDIFFLCRSLTYIYFLSLQLVLKNEVTLYYNSRHSHVTVQKVLFGFATGVRFLPTLLTKEYFWNNSGWSKQQTRSCFSFFWSVEYNAGHPMLHKMADRSVRQWRLSELSVQSK